MRAVIWLDGGSTSSKAVLVSEKGDVLTKAYRLSKGNPIQDMKDLLSDLRTQVVQQSATLEVLGFGATGYAADVLEKTVGADVNIVETVAHMMSARHFFPDVDVICDVGGQDIKVLMLQNGDIKDFRLSNQCSAGNGMLLQAMAQQFGVPLSDYADTAFAAQVTPILATGVRYFWIATGSISKGKATRRKSSGWARDRAAEKYLAIRSADSSSGFAWNPLCVAGRHAVQPGGSQGPV